MIFFYLLHLCREFFFNSYIPILLYVKLFPCILASKVTLFCTVTWYQHKHTDIWMHIYIYLKVYIHKFRCLGDALSPRPSTIVTGILLTLNSFIAEDSGHQTFCEFLYHSLFNKAYVIKVFLLFRKKKARMKSKLQTIWKERRIQRLEKNTKIEGDE